MQKANSCLQLFFANTIFHLANDPNNSPNLISEHQTIRKSVFVVVMLFLYGVLPSPFMPAGLTIGSLVDLHSVLQGPLMTI